ncbi:hypothetical protein M3P05_09400 [Sansalvadorimonas sp. 2012CJ34-2]|uniref:Fork-head domain-containing protein n=1 Tax=Parendozoicomonas callyspongiae TaxID=2942213 RepID=A0ABT0PI34_9GAMM|nr:hypothetical protein [Sansalvadorimonas sp. 2012CJ34-2]MCL6270148.1 hypothetical protein [Sansalvadorimonas sp. 2012CJ34-2]
MNTSSTDRTTPGTLPAIPAITSGGMVPAATATATATATVSGVASWAGREVGLVQQPFVPLQHSIPPHGFPLPSYEEAIQPGRWRTTCAPPLDFGSFYPQPTPYPAAHSFYPQPTPYPAAHSFYPQPTPYPAAHSFYPQSTSYSAAHLFRSDQTVSQEPAIKSGRYASVITQAIQSFSENKATVKQIYQYLTSTYPYEDKELNFDVIRSTLSSNQKFIKTNQRGGKEAAGQGRYWTLRHTAGAQEPEPETEDLKEAGLYRKQIILPVVIDAINDHAEKKATSKQIRDYLLTKYSCYKKEKLSVCLGILLSASDQFVKTEEKGGGKSSDGQGYYWVVRN